MFSFVTNTTTLLKCAQPEVISVAPQSEVIRAIFLEDSPCCGVSFVTNTTALLLFLPGPTRAGVVRLELDALGFPADRELRSRAGQLQPQTETKGSLGGIRTACGDEQREGGGGGGYARQSSRRASSCWPPAGGRTLSSRRRWSGSLKGTQPEVIRAI